MSTTRRVTKPKCQVCAGGGSLHEMALVPASEEKRNHVAGAMRLSSNKALVCQPCHRAYLVLCGRAAPDATTAPIVILHRPELDALIERRNEARKVAKESQMHFPFGSVESESRYQGRLEGI